MTKHVFSSELKPSCKPAKLKPVYAGPLPCVHAPLDGELLLHNECFEAIAFVGGVRISLGVFCHRNAACWAIVEAVGGEA